MANLPPRDPSDSFTYEIYDESSHQDPTLIWLSPLEESSVLNEPIESSENLSLEPALVYIPTITCASPLASAPEPIPSESPLEEEPSSILEPAYHHSSVPQLPFRPAQTSDQNVYVRMPVAISPLTYKSLTQASLAPWLFRLAALVSILLIGSLLPAILENMHATRVKAVAALGSAAPGTQNAGGPRSQAVRVLTIMASQNDTVKSIALRYLGRFDDHLYEEIRTLNPSLKDADHLEDGQLIRIPLRRATTK